MNANFLSIVKRIIREQGEGILADPPRLKGFISDYAKNEPKPERLAFGRCIEYGAYGELKRAASPQERGRVKAAFAQRLHNAEGLDMAFCTGALDLLEAAVWGTPAPSARPAPSAYPASAAPQYPPAYTRPAPSAYGASAAPQSSYNASFYQQTGQTGQPGQLQTNAMLRKAARSQLKGSWLAAAGMSFIWFCLLLLAGFTVIGSLIVSGPLMLGLCGYFLTKARGGRVTVSNLFDGFNMFGRAFLLEFLTSIFIALWSLLLIIPGIIKGLSYSMAYYIVLDNPQMNALDAITASRKMMNGYKGKLFCLHLGFIGWGLLCILSLGIGLFWLIPYAQLAGANFYEDLRKNSIP
jgi:uncharacterized membrane protein